MTRIKKDQNSVKIAADAMKNGHVAVFPTDTVYGFSGAVETSSKTFLTQSKIRNIKGRDETKPFIRLIACPEDLSYWTEDKVPQELLAFWPGALTVIVRLKDQFLEETESSTCAFRCPGDKWLRDVIRESGVSAIYSTSVNRTGRNVLDDPDDIQAEFEGEIDLLVDDGKKTGALPSTIVAVENGKIRIVRQGAVDLGDIVSKS